MGKWFWTASQNFTSKHARSNFKELGCWFNKQKISPWKVNVFATIIKQNYMDHVLSMSITDDWNHSTLHNSPPPPTTIGHHLLLVSLTSAKSIIWLLLCTLKGFLFHYVIILLSLLLGWWILNSLGWLFNSNISREKAEIP